METIRDCHGHVICKANAHDGTLEVKYRHLLLELKIAEDDKCTIGREDTITYIQRVKNTHFIVSSYVL